MDFGYNENQEAIREVARELCGRFDEDYWQKVDAEHYFPREFWDEMVSHDLVGIALPEEYGGSGQGILEVATAAEALAEHGAGTDGGSLHVAGPVFGGILLARHGTERQKERELPGILQGDLWAGAFTEAGGGSNVTGIRTTAERKGDSYVINGEKTFISQVQNAKRIVAMVRTSPYDPEKRTRGISLVYGDLPSPRVEARPFRKMGANYMDTNQVYFDDFEVPAENLIGDEGNAWGPLYDVLNPERIVIAAAAIGTGTLAINRAVEFAQERQTWGVPIGGYQGIQFPLAKARAELDAARLKVFEAAWLYDQRRDCGVAAASAKYSAAHAALHAADAAIQTFGGAGYITESGIERHWRNLRLNRLAPVTDEMTLSYIAQHGLGLPRSY